MTRLCTMRGIYFTLLSALIASLFVCNLFIRYVVVALRPDAISPKMLPDEVQKPKLCPNEVAVSCFLPHSNAIYTSRLLIFIASAFCTI